MQTYSERRQATFYRCSRELRAVAASVLDDVINDAEFRGSTAPWAKALAAHTADKANEMERLGDEQCYTGGQTLAANRRSHEKYGESIDRFEARWQRVNNEARSQVV